MTGNILPRISLPDEIDGYRNELAPWASNFRPRQFQDATLTASEQVVADAVQGAVEAQRERREAEAEAEEGDKDGDSDEDMNENEIENQDGDEDEDEDGDADRDENENEDGDGDVMDIDDVPPSANLSGANLRVARLFFDQMAQNGGITDGQVEQPLHHVDTQTLGDTNAVLTSDEQELRLRQHQHRRGIFPHLQALEQQARSRNPTIFAGRADINELWTAQSLSSSLPGLDWTLGQRFTEIAESLPVNLDGLDYVAGTFGTDAEAFFWEDAVDEAIVEFGRDRVEEALFITLPRNILTPSTDTTSSSTSRDPSIPDPNHLPMWPRTGLHTLPGLQRIEADNIRRGWVDPENIAFNVPVNVGFNPPAVLLMWSLHGIDVAIRRVFGGGHNTRHLVLHYLNYLAEYYIIRRGALEGGGADASAWESALRNVTEDSSSFVVEEELFVDWLDPAYDELSPFEQQLLYLMRSVDEGTSDSAIALFKSAYAAHRESDGRREEREASEQLRALVQRQARLVDRVRPPPVCIPEALRIHEEADEARRRGLEEEIALERQRRRLPPSSDDDEYSDEQAFGEGDRIRNLREEEMAALPPVLRFINQWFLFRSEQLLENDLDEEEWQHWGIQLRQRILQLPEDAAHRVAYLNLVEGTDVEVLLRREERQHRYVRARQQPADHTSDAQNLAFPRETILHMSPAQRREYLDEFDSVSSRLLDEYEDTLSQVPREVYDRATEQEEDWFQGRLATWQNGANCGYLPAVNMVRQYYEEENDLRMARAESPLSHMEAELVVARAYDAYSHQAAHQIDLVNITRHLPNQ